MRSVAGVVLTTERRLGAGPVLRKGTAADYRSVGDLPGEPHMVRTDLVAGAPPAVARHGKPVACFVHITDLHVTDAQSPARFEFVNRHWQDPRFRELLTMQRPQEMLNTHAVEALVRTINSLERGPLTGGPIQLVAMTGDAIDNTQRNELDNFLALMNGGEVRPDSGSPGYQGVQLEGWPAEYCWHPDGTDEGDDFRRLLGFPSHPRLLDQAVQPFRAEGLRVPWIGCYGNHEQACQGVGVVTPALIAAMSGSRKAIDMPPDIDPDTAVETFVRHPDHFLTGRAVEVAPDAARRPITRAEFASALGRDGSHFLHDTDRVRFVALDTVCDAGGADGTIDEAQLAWLESAIEGAGGRYVVVLSHHGFATLSNPRGERRADGLLALLERSPAVVLWVNGHIHANRVTPRAGLWEVTTAALVDWPCQARLVELFETAAGQLAVACTMLDHAGTGLAALHRELAGNVPFNGFDSWRPGRPEDRNVVLPLPRSRCA